MKKIQLLTLFAIITLLSFGPTSAQDDFEATISRNEWPVGASTEAVIAIPQLRFAVKRLTSAENAVMIVRYPGGDAGNQWAVEVRNRLVSLGIESKHIEIQPGSGIEDTLLIIVYDQRITL